MLNTMCGLQLVPFVFLELLDEGTQLDRVGRSSVFVVRRRGCKNKVLARNVVRQRPHLFAGMGVKVGVK